MWAGDRAADSGSLAGTDGAYQRATTRVDEQFADFMDGLKRRGLLDNAIVVVLSDHGESTAVASPEKLPADADLAAALEPSENMGHGTSVFAREQYHVVLGFKRFQRSVGSGTPWPERITAAPASLEDVTPTLAELLNLRSAAGFDGVSLVPLLNGETTAPQLRDRVRFTETEFNPASIAPQLSMGSMLNSRTLRDALELYHVDPRTDRVTLRREGLPHVMAKRQFAAFRAGRTLATFSSAMPGDDLALAYVAGNRALPLRITDTAALRREPDAEALKDALLKRFPDLAARVILPPATVAPEHAGRSAPPSRL